MNPAGIRLEEKKEDAKSLHSYKSTHSSRSSVLERARAYNQRIEEDQRRRSRSLERPVNASDTAGSRSQSTGRAAGGPRLSTRERAMASVRSDANKPQPPSQSTDHTQPLTPTSQYSQRQQQTPRSSTPRNNAPQRQHSPRESNPDNAVVTPELLVDALSGQEDGLLAIAEKLMEHYDQGYDVMGEAIIDAFADVQKLFQHVVEAAHMEGAAFEASRRDQELERQNQSADHLLPTPTSASTGGMNRHDEFVDQDVKDILTEAIRQGSTLRDQNKHMECFEMYDRACQSAMALLPVDSDHRGRLQLSLSRAESMSADRACAILRYSMDDVLRSGLRAHQTPLPDPSQRADVVLDRSMAGQSSDEALASLQEELKELMNAPMYNETPLQSVATRFFGALTESQKVQQKNADRLEQNLAKLKGDFLLARAEWEEKLTTTSEQAELYKSKYESVRDQTNGESYMNAARSFVSEDFPRSASRAGSVASLSSGLAQEAKRVVKSLNQFNCTTAPERTGAYSEDRRRSRPKYSTPQRPRSASRSKPSSRSFQDYSRSPQRMDV